MSNERYQVILADAPWSFKVWSGKKDKKYGTADAQYHVMTPESILALPVPEIAAGDSVLWLWAVASQLPLALEVMAAWGFTYKTVGFNWIKRTKAGTDKMGMGHHTRQSTELCLLGVKGKGLPRVSHSVRQVIETVPGRHSAKPRESLERIDHLYGPDVSKIELFARGREPGWDSWGDEADEYITTESEVSSMWGSKLVMPRLGYR